MIIRGYKEQDLSEMVRIWNEVVEDGIAFPQEEVLDMKSGAVIYAMPAMRFRLSRAGSISERSWFSIALRRAGRSDSGSFSSTLL